jgi:hypothetical protein
MPAEKLGQPPPIVQAMLLADHIHIDPATGKRYILGTYNQLMGVRFPHIVSRLNLFIALTEAHGPTLLRVRVVDMDEEFGSLVESTHSANMFNPNDLYYFSLTLSVTFPTPGIYRIQLFAENELLRELRLRVDQRQLPAPHSPEE